MYTICDSLSTTDAERSQPGLKDRASKEPLSPLTITIISLIIAILLKLIEGKEPVLRPRKLAVGI
jgi:hypothetical protein